MAGSPVVLGRSPLLLFLQSDHPLKVRPRINRQMKKMAIPSAIKNQSVKRPPIPLNAGQASKDLPEMERTPMDTGFNSTSCNGLVSHQQHLSILSNLNHNTPTFLSNNCTFKFWSTFCISRRPAVPVPSSPPRLPSHQPYTKNATTVPALSAESRGVILCHICEHIN